MSFVCGVRLALSELTGITFVVDEHPTSDKATAVVPVVERRQLHLLVLIAVILGQLLDVGLDAIVTRLTWLVVEMAERVPLAGALRVELDLVVVSVGRKRGVDERRDLVNESLPPEARRLDRPDGPVERDGDTILELLVGFLKNLGGDDVQRAVDVLLAALVEHAPCAACEFSAVVG